MSLSNAWITGLLVAAGMWCGVCRAAVPKSVYTSKTQFAIPFRSDAAEIQRIGAREVRLFVSVDQGANWVQVQSVRPAGKRFSVQAPKDGTYWFSVRTVDRAGRLHPEAALAAELIVVVDTESPSMELKLRQLSNGKLELAWKSADTHLDVSTLVLETRLRGERNWQKLFVPAAGEGKTSWEVPNGGVIEVRGRISDRAANVVIATDSIHAIGSKLGVPRPSVPNLETDPIAAVMGKSSGGSRMLPQFPTSAGVSPSEKRAGRLPAGFQPASRENHTTRNASSRRLKPEGSNQLGPVIVPGGRASVSGGPVPGTVPNHVSPSNVGRRPQAGDSGFPQTPSAARRSQPEIPTRIVNQKRFRLSYTVDRVGRSGVEAVELFITVNNGGKWYRYGTDPDLKSPFLVDMPKDGNYGFTIRVRSGAGIGDPPPKPGEKPDIIVIVDQTGPKIELLPILQGRGSDSDKFLIRWKLADSHPAKKPVSVSYSVSPRGPWQMISGWQTNTGSYLWKSSNDIPSRVYIRLTARDAAGNISAVQTKRPIIIDIVKPTARITNVDVSPN